MGNKLAHTNISFDFLSNSSDFLNCIINNINSCVLLLNSKMELKAYNDALFTIFNEKSDEDILYHRCGEVIGCAYQIEEAKDCGSTSHCKTCPLRLTAIKAYTDDIPVYKQMLSRPFYNNNFEKVIKHLQCSIKLFYYNEEKYIVLLIEDVTELVDLRNKFQSNPELL